LVGPIPTRPGYRSILSGHEKANRCQTVGFIFTLERPASNHPTCTMSETKVTPESDTEKRQNGHLLNGTTWEDGLSNTERERLARIKATRMTDKTTIRNKVAAVTIAGGTFARLGDLSLVMGQRKAGKTTIQQYIIATALMEEKPPDMDTLQIQTTYCDGRDVLYIDTEGSDEDTWNFIEGVKRILGVSEQPANLYVYHWRELDVKDCKDFLETLYKIHHNSHLWIIDGVADLSENPDTDVENNRKLVRSIMRAASELNACFVCIIHDNPAKSGQQNKARGHLGSELERKASGAIEIEKNKQEKQHYIRCRFVRKGEDFEPITFWFENGHPASRMLSESEKQRINQPDYYRIKELTTLRNQCFLGLVSRPEKDLKSAVERYQGSSSSKDATRKKRDRNIEGMLKHNLIRLSEVDGERFYFPVNLTAPASILELHNTDSGQTGRA
jgi:hypothetical protein